MELRNHVSRSGVQVDVDAPKGQDLAQVMEDVRANYEKIAAKNADDLKRWHENQVMRPENLKSTREYARREISFVSICPFFFFFQIADVQVQVSQNTEALQGAQVEMGDLSRQIQTLEIELSSQQSLVSGQFTQHFFQSSACSLQMMTGSFQPLIRKPPWKTRYTTQSYGTTWKWRSTTASFFTWRRS